MNFQQGSVALGGVLAVLTALVGFVTAIYWMIVGWRAMRAHERIADALGEKLNR